MSGESYYPITQSSIVLKSIKNHLKSQKNSETFKEPVKKMNSKLDFYIDLNKNEHLICQFLDPKIKNSFLSGDLKKTLIVEVEKVFDIYIDKSKDTSESLTDVKEPVSSSLLDRLKLKEINNSSKISEIKQYLSKPCFEGDLDIINWWSMHQDKYPTLFKMALDYLPMQATSVCSERAFSIGGLICDKKRNRLSTESVNMILCLKSWNRIPNLLD